PTNAASIAYALTFSESVTGLTAGDFGHTGTATGCTVGAPAGSGASYTVAVTGCLDGTLALTLNANSVVDAASNTGPASPATAATVTIDRTAPTVSSFAPTTASPTNAASIAYALTFSESVTGLTAGDFGHTGTATGCTVGAPAGSGASYTVAVTGCSDGTLALTLNANTVQDLATNLGPLTSSTAATVTVDRTAPTLLLSALPSGSPTNATSFAVTAAFSEAVSGFTSADVTLGGTSNATTPWTVGAVSGGPSTYSFTVSAATPADGGLTIAVAAARASDAAGNGNQASNTLAYTIDRTGPSVVSFAPTTASPTNAATINYALTFSVSVSGLTASDFSRTGTATGCVIGAPAGSGASYTIAVTGCSAGTVVLTLKAGSVVDAASNNGPVADVTSASVLIDRTAPSTSGPTVSLRAGVVLSGTSLPVVLTWTAADTGGAGLATYDMARSYDGAPFAVVVSGLTTPTTTSTTTSGHTYRFEIRAHDSAGNVGGWVAGPTLHPTLYQQTGGSIVYHGTWTTQTASVYSGGSSRYATGAGASASYTFTGRSVAFVTALAWNRGAVKVYIDGVLVTTVDCYAATATYHDVAYARTWASSGTHTIKLVVVGTAGRPRVDLDAIEVLG
ncbi:MAG: Ig-like domain-containing protein, partial [Acidimicrobiia bacterium]